MTTKKTGIALIREERVKQVQVYGYGSEHDKQHTQGELAAAAAYYAAPRPIYEKDETTFRISFSDPWPFMNSQNTRPKKPTYEQRVHLLVKAGALIAAEIDRLQAKGRLP